MNNKVKKGLFMYLVIVSVAAGGVMILMNFTLLPSALPVIEEVSAVRAETVRTRAVGITIITFVVSPALIFLLSRVNAGKRSGTSIKDETETERVYGRESGRLLILLIAAHILISLLIGLYILNIFGPLYTLGS